MPTMQLQSPPPRAINSPLARRRHLARASRSAARFGLEPLETRTLMSVTFSTVDNLQHATGSAMAADSAGNVYAVGAGLDDTGVKHVLVREKFNGSSAWSTIFSAPNGIPALAVDSAGDVTVSSSVLNGSIYTCTIWQRPVGQSFAIADQIIGFDAISLAADGGGNVFATGGSGITGFVGDWQTRRQSGGTGAFALVDDFVTGYSSAVGEGIKVIGGTGPSAGIYAMGYGHNNSVNGNTADWVVRKSTDGGNSWSTVDVFHEGPTAMGSSAAVDICADRAGNLFVVGYGEAYTITGYTKVNGQQQPVYSMKRHWIVRKSSTGSAGSWTINDDYLSSGPLAAASSVVTDLAGNVYVSGYAMDTNGNGIAHAIIRTIANGKWKTVDDYRLASGASATWSGSTVDANGTLYVSGWAYDSFGGTTHWIIRAAAGPSAPQVVQVAVTSSLAPTTPPAPKNSHASPTIEIVHTGTIIPASLAPIASNNLLPSLLP
jgi:hypothetical protein